MFGGSLDPPKLVKRTRPKPMTYDIQLPTCTPGVYGHMARAPNTNYHVEYLHYRQKIGDAHIHMLAAEAKRLTKERIEARYDKHNEQKIFQRHIQERFKEKVQAYEDSVEKRRQKLKELLCSEEEEFIRETISLAQKGVDNKMQEMKQKAQQLKAQREAERLEIVKEKQLQQMIEDCQELRPVMIKRNLIESKNTQLQQIRENELKKEAQRDMDNLWYQLMLKQIEIKLDRENADKLKEQCAMKANKESWDQQLLAKKLMLADAERTAAEERLEMVKLHEQIRREQIEALDAKRRKRDLIAKELKEQLAVQERFAAQRKREEEALNSAMSQLAEAEIERERQKIQDVTSLAKRETAMYRQHLRELEEERKQEDKQLNDLLEEHRKMIEKKQEEAYCKLKLAREKLRENVLAERAEQLRYKQQEAENQLKFKEAENELCRMACETNERLQAEHDRLQAEKAKEYGEVLKKQIEENNEKRRREKDELQRELAEGLAEEERYRKRVLEVIDARLKNEDGPVHPFRRVLQNCKCPCPSNTWTNY